MGNGDWAQRCRCGLMKFIIKEVDGVALLREVVPRSEMKIPEKGSKLHRCFVALAVVYPSTLNTRVVSTNSGLTPKETSALLVALLSRGIVERVEGRRGRVGGSIWKLSSTAQKMVKP